jgi:hypothetical protein
MYALAKIVSVVHAGRDRLSQLVERCRETTTFNHPMPSSVAGGGTGRSWYSFHMSGFACVANASSGAGGGTGKEVRPALFPHCLAERQWTFRRSMGP